MRFNVPIALLILVALAHALSAVDAPKPAAAAAAATQPKHETVWASRTLHIPEAPEVDMFRRMVRAAGAQHGKILGVDPDRAEQIVDVVPRSGDGLFGGSGNVPSVNRVDLVAKLDGKVPNRRADEFLDGVVESLRERLRSWLAETGGLADAERRLREAEHDVDKNRAELREYENVVRRTTGRVDATIEQVRAAAAKLEEERQALKLQVVGKQARQDAITDAVARLSKAAEQRAVADPVAAELEKIVKAREVAKQRIKLLFERQAASETELAEADGPIAETRAKLLERREAVAQANGGELLSALNRELATVSIDVAEARAMLAALEEQLKRFDEVRDVLDRAERVRMIETRLLRSLDEADRTFREATKGIPNRPLRVVNSDSMTPDDPRLSQPGVDPSLRGR